MKTDLTENDVFTASMVGRISATVIDYFLIFWVCFGLMIVVEELSFYLYGVLKVSDLPANIQTLRSIILWGIWLAIPLFYLTFGEGSRGFTIGKYFLGIKVVDEKTFRIWARILAKLAQGNFYISVRSRFNYSCLFVLLGKEESDL